MPRPRGTAFVPGSVASRQVQPGEVETIRRAITGEEITVHRDMGCNYAPSCLACPLPRCKHDVYARSGR